MRFGTYELSVQSGELRKAGVRIRVQQQPLKLLEVLLERPGEVGLRSQAILDRHSDALVTRTPRVEAGVVASSGAHHVPAAVDGVHARQGPIDALGPVHPHDDGGRAV